MPPFPLSAPSLSPMHFFPFLRCSCSFPSYFYFQLLTCSFPSLPLSSPSSPAPAFLLHLLLFPISDLFFTLSSPPPPPTAISRS